MAIYTKTSVSPSLWIESRQFYKCNKKFEVIPVFVNDTSIDTSRDHRQRGGLRKSAARRGGAPASRLSMTKRMEVHQQVHFDLRDSFGYFSLKKSDKKD